MAPRFSSSANPGSASPGSPPRRSVPPTRPAWSCCAAGRDRSGPRFRSVRWPRRCSPSCGAGRPPSKPISAPTGPSWGGWCPTGITATPNGTPRSWCWPRRCCGSWVSWDVTGVACWSSTTCTTPTWRPSRSWSTCATTSTSSPACSWPPSAPNPGRRWTWRTRPPAGTPAGRCTWNGSARRRYGCSRRPAWTATRSGCRPRSPTGCGRTAPAIRWSSRNCCGAWSARAGWCRAPGAGSWCGPCAPRCRTPWCAASPNAPTGLAPRGRRCSPQPPSSAAGSRCPSCNASPGWMTTRCWATSSRRWPRNSSPPTTGAPTGTPSNTR